MGIVHSALRRDLRRAHMVLETAPYPTENRRRALADHILWMTEFLHMHHTGEDRGLWPLIRSRKPSARELLDRMDADHKRIGPAIVAVQEAAGDYRNDEAARERMVGAITALDDVLLPHLRREELEMMPVVAKTITTDEFRAVEHEYFVEPKGFVELGTEAHWVLDGLDPEGRAVMLRVVPAVPRFILLHGFARRYRRRRALLWGDGPAAAVPSLSVGSAIECS
jgi:hemerythrin-like domain-containing protein